jgi:oligopeptide/dipeptide ABC transporter ATP-binding protein
MPGPHLLKVEGLTTMYPLSRAHVLAPRRFMHAVDGVDLELDPGATLGLVGESGSGKSTTALSILRLIEPSHGKVIFNGENILTLSRRDMRAVRRKMQIIFQDPYSSLNPKWRVEDIICEPLDVQRTGTRAQRRARVGELLEIVGLRSDHASRFPAEFSGGQRQRIAIARALATEPELLVCDEIVSALDVAVQAKILNLMTTIQKTLGVSFLFISHDLSVVYHMCRQIAVMYLGTIVERASRANLFERPLHPYTNALLSAVPRVGEWSSHDDVVATPRDELGSPLAVTTGCRFAPRCSFAIERCITERPALRQIEDSWVACHRVTPSGVREWNDNSPTALHP